MKSFRRRLTSANITDHNEDTEIVAPTTQTLADFDPAQSLTLPPYSLTLLEWTQTPRQAWRHQHFGTVANTGPAADLADPDGDSRPNLAEYALGTDPLNAASAATLSAQFHDEAGQQYLTIETARNPAASDVTFTAEVSPDLNEWFSGPAHTTTLADTPTLFRARDTTAISDALSRFIRLRVSSP